MYRFVGLAELYYAGSHGMDIMGPKVAENCVTPADEQVRMLFFHWNAFGWNWIGKEGGVRIYNRHSNLRIPPLEKGCNSYNHNKWSVQIKYWISVGENYIMICKRVRQHMTCLLCRPCSNCMSSWVGELEDLSASMMWSSLSAYYVNVHVGKGCNFVPTCQRISTYDWQGNVQCKVSATAS